MSRVEAAVSEGRCVIAVGGRALQSPDLLIELRRRSVPSVALGADPVNPVGPLTADNIAAATGREGGVIVLVEPEASTDGRALEALAKLLSAAKHKPRICVAARAFNPFGLPMSLRLMKIEHIKQRATDFVASLPVGGPVVVEAAPAQAAPAAPAASDEPADESDRSRAPRPLFIGREDELPALVALIGEPGGGIVVTGPQGVGRRWLVERALADGDLTRLPDLTFGRGIGADTFLARVAAICQEAGDDALATALRKPSTRPKPAELAELVARALSNPGLKGKVWVIHDLHRHLDRRDGSLYRMGRLELALRAILLSTPELRIIFTSNLAPTFYREGESANLRVFPVAGLKGKELHQLWKAWHVPDVPRDRFGAVVERTHGHPVSTRFLGLAVAEGTDIDELLAAPRLLKASDINDLEPLKRHLKRKIEGLDKGARGRLAAVAHLREPATAQDLAMVGLNRTDRIALQSAGLLDQTPYQEDRRYYVHPLVSEHMEYQEITNFETMEQVGRALQERGRDRSRSLVARLSDAQEANRLLTEARRDRARDRLPFPDNDAFVDTVFSLIRRRKPRFDIARGLLNQVLKDDPSNPELLAADAELKHHEKAGAEAVAGSYDKAAEVAPTPELFHQEASHYLERNLRGKAASAMEKGVAAFPGDARLRRRLAGLYLRQNRDEDAARVLREAMELEPMMPDTYGMLGEIYLSRGQAHWEEATQFIDEALRLDPERPHHLVRLGLLLWARGVVDLESREALWAEAEEKLQAAVTGDTENPRAHGILSGIILDRRPTIEEADLDRAEWMAKKAMKLSESAEAMVARARVLVRRAAFVEAERLLDKAIKKEPSLHSAFATQGELWMAQGQVFMAFESYKKSRERTPKDSADRALVEEKLAELAGLIEAGVAADLMRAGEAEGAAQAESAAEGEDGPRRDAGSTTVLRKSRRGRRGRRGGDDAAQRAEDDATDELGAEPSTEEVAADPSAEESAAQDAAPETPAEESAAQDAAPDAPAEESAAQDAAPDAPAEDAAQDAVQDAAPEDEAPEAPAQEGEA